MEKPTKKERKNRIKNQNAMRKQPHRSLEPKTPEEFDRQMRGFVMIALGLLKVVGIDPAKFVKEAEEFPSELDLDAQP